MGGDAVREFLAGGLLDLLHHLRLHEAAGALGHQVVDGDAVDDVQRVEHVALALGHLLALAVADQAGEVDVLERNLPGQVVGGHDHARHPEEDDVEAGDQHRRRQVAVEATLGHGLRVRPAQGGERPDLRGEPGFQHVAFLAQHHVAAQVVLCAHFIFAAADVAAAGGGIEPGRNAVAPPQLAADAPVLDVVHPVAIGVDPVRRHEGNRTVLDQLQATTRQLVHLHEPLVGQIGLDHLAGTVAARHLQLVRLGLDQHAQVFQFAQHGLARFVAVHALEAFGRVFIQRRHRGEQVDHRQAVAHAHLVIVEIVRRGDLDHAGTERAVDVVVGDHRHAAAGQRQHHALADQVRVALIFRVHHHRGIAQQGFRAGGGHDQVVAGFAQGFHAVGIALDVLVAQAFIQRVGDRPQEAVFLGALHFQVRDRGLQHRIPVDQALAAVDQALFVPAHEGLDHRFGRLRVHGEGAARPVGRGAQAAHLPLDDVTGLLLPLPDLADEAFAAQRIAGLALAFQRQVAADHHFGGDAGMVGTHLPQRVVAAHAVVAHQCIHQGLLEGMAHVQGAGHVRRRQQDGVGLALAGRLEVAGLLPGLVEVGLEGLRVVAGGELGHAGEPGGNR